MTRIIIRAITINLLRLCIYYKTGRRVCLEVNQALEKRLEDAEAGEEAEDEDVDNQPAKLGASEVAKVVIARHESEADAENPADNGNCEEEGVGEVAPHGNRGVAVGDGDLDRARSRSGFRSGGSSGLLGSFRSFGWHFSFLLIGEFRGLLRRII